MIHNRMASLPLFFGLLILTVFEITPYYAWAHEVSFETDPKTPLVYLNVAVKAGSVTDPKNLTGLTHFMGEMLLRGTSSHTKQQIDLALDQMGARLDVETRAEALIFRGAVLSTQLKEYFKLVQEILTQPSFPEVEIAKLKAETLSGIQEELGHDGSLSSRKFTEFLFNGHPYGQPVIGKIKDITSLTQAQIAAQYRLLMRNSLLLFIGSGDAAESDISNWSEQVTRLLPDSPLTAEESQRLAQVAAPQNSPSRRLLILDKPDRTQTQIHIGQIGIKMTDSDFFPLHLGNYAFGGGSFSAILMSEIRVKRGWSYGANSGFRFGKQPRSWFSHLFPASKDTVQALTLTLDLIKNLENEGITQAQFDFAQRSLVNSAGFMANTPRKRVENRLLEKTLNLPTDFIKSYGPQTQKLHLNEVNQALKKFIKSNQLAILVLGTAKDLQESLIRASGISADQIQIAPYNQEN